MKKKRFEVWDKDKKVMHQADEICRIHFDKGLPYCVFLWEDEAIFNFILKNPELIGRRIE